MAHLAVCGSAGKPGPDFLCGEGEARYMRRMRREDCLGRVEGAKPTALGQWVREWRIEGQEHMLTVADAIESRVYQFIAWHICSKLVILEEFSCPAIIYQVRICCGCAPYVIAKVTVLCLWFQQKS